MKLPQLTALLCIAGAVFADEGAVSTPASEPPSTLRESVNSLDESQIQKALEALETNYLSKEVLEGSARQKALLEGLVSRLAPGASLVSDTEKPKEPIPFLAEILDERAGYIRPGAMNADALTQMDAALENFASKAMPALILDLRAIPGGSEFDMAAGFAKRFCPKGSILFTIEKPNAKQERILTSDKDAVFTGILVVLVDSDTSGAAEALAASLRTNASAMIVGMTTTGGAVEFAEFPLGGGRMLRVAVAQVIVPGAGALFPEGVKPDISVSLDPEIQSRIFKRSQEQGVSQFVFDIERPRLNEAALLANTNPEITGTNDGDNAGDSLRDIVLQRAVDLVTAITFYQK